MSQASSQFETETRVDVRSLPGYRWDESGQSVLSGALLDLYRRIDNMFLRWAGDCQAPEFFFPTFISAHELGNLDYFRSFPNVLTPAACYHFYVLFQGQTLEEPRYVTTRATCFRRENHYLPLERQWNFSMREIVCIGSSDEVKSFLARYREKVDAFFRSVNLPIQWDAATDPFFNPSRNPKFLAQRLDPVKTEMVFKTGLAIGSVNFHRNYFGEAFQISREGQDAFSGCVAFGIERWIFAFINHFGPNPEDWPDLGRLSNGG